MSLEETQKELIKAANGKGHYRDLPVSISIIQSHSQTCSTLETLAKENAFVNLIKIEKEIPKGYFVFDSCAVSLWDSTQLTKHPKEIEEGVILRYYIINNKLVNKIIDKHNQLLEKYT